MRKRQAARVLLFSPQSEILLVHFAIPQPDGSDFHFWATPGGEIEGEESPTEAMRREIAEELGLDLDLEGPLWTDGNQFFHQGQMCDNTDFYFRATCPREAPRLIGVTEDELRIMKEIRWWTLAELEATTDKIFPVDLIGWAHRLLGI